MPVKPISLSTQSGLKILETIHQNSVRLEDDYKSFKYRNRHLRNFEELLDCSNMILEDKVQTVGDCDLTYIQYRKCHYLYTIQKWRESLMRQEVMTPEMMRGLMELAMRLFRPGKDKEEPGALALQAILTCQWTESLLALTTGNSFTTKRPVI